MTAFRSVGLELFHHHNPAAGVVHRGRAVKERWIRKSC